MNERIFELVEQALNIVSNKRTLKDGQLERTWDPAAFDEVFAELIIKECGKWVNDNVGLLDEEAQADLLKHFGVKK
jgi:hypothetical protein